MKAKTMNDQIVTANRLRDGRVVFLTQDGEWSARVADSRPASGAAADLLLSVAQIAADARIVVNPYLIDVAVAGGSPWPVLARERIRATGPTIDETAIREDA
jgi:hypothetical protein